MVREGREGEERGKAHGWQKERYDVLKIQNDRTLGVKLKITHRTPNSNFAQLKGNKKVRMP